MKITKKTLKEIEKQTGNKLKKYVCNYFLKEEDLKNSIEDLLNYGCVNGQISALCYHADTTSFFEEYKEEINELLKEALSNCGGSFIDVFGKKWDAEDPLCFDVPNQNLLAWFGFEEMTWEISQDLGML